MDSEQFPARSHTFPSWPGRGLWNLFSLAVLLLGAGWIWLSAANPGGTTGGEIPAPRAGFLAPDFSLPNADGNLITLSDLRGQAVLVNLWASWCAPCQAEMPAMQRVYKDYGDQSFTILAVNATNQDSQAAALQFAAEKNLTFPILFDLDGSVSRSYQLTALPTSYFILPDGTIKEVIIGGPMAEALLRVRVEQILEAR
ncbi:MAG TPA: TlpA disulfide reductase family protein [Anaerolineales bacterium]|nr:TlpA disulfide reductase family protein [Anaerolineales bacterium]